MREIATPPLSMDQNEPILTRWLNFSFTIVMILTFTIHIIPRILFADTPPDPTTISTEQLTGMLFSGPILFAITLFPIAIFIAPQITVLEKLKLNNIKLLYLPIAVAAAVAIFLACSIISTYSRLIMEILDIKMTKSLVPLLAKECSNTSFIVIAFGVIIVAPLIEEIIFRRIIYSWLVKKSSKWVAIILTSALFAIIHDSLSVFAALFFLAIGFQLIYLKYNSLIPAIIMHACFNSITVIILLLIRMGLIPEATG